MTNETRAAQNIINSINVSLGGCQRPDIMMNNILDRAQALVNDEGYAWTVALSMACKIYPSTEYCGQAAYAK